MGESLRILHDPVNNRLTVVLIRTAPASDRQIRHTRKLRIRQDLLHHNRRSLPLLILFIIICIPFRHHMPNPLFPSDLPSTASNTHTHSPAHPVSVPACTADTPDNHNRHNPAHPSSRTPHAPARLQPRELR